MYFYLSIELYTMKKLLFLVSTIALFITACDFSKGPDVSHIDVELDPQLFFIDLFEMDEAHLEKEIEKLHQKYGSYLDAYSQQIIRIGSPENPRYPALMKEFLNYGDNQDVYKACKKQYEDIDEIKEDLTDAFKHYKYYFNDAKIPEIYLHTSYFNESVAMDSSWVSVSVEKYLGADCEFYEWLGTHKYMRKGMVPEKLVPDVMKAMALGNFSFQMKNEDILSEVISEAKVLHFVKHMMPELNDTLLFDYSDEQMRWCYNHEGDIWASMVEQKHLFSSERMMIQKYVGNSPFTYYFGQNSPGKAAVFLGYRIIEAYLKNNPELQLEDLIKEQDGHKILQESRYRP